MVVVQWNAADKSPHITLSGTPALTAKADGTNVPDAVRADTSIAAGSGKKWYFEIVASNIIGAPNPGNNNIGLANSSFPLFNTTPQGTLNSVGWRDDGATFINYGGCGITGSTTWGVNGTVMSIAVRTDVSPPKLWVRANGGTWDSTSGDDPATNVGGCDLSSLTFPLFPLYTGASFNSQVTAQFASASWTYSAPAGFTAWGN
jgi:hypothetical protein